MFNIERWQEIFQTIAKNKLRTFLTGVSVASGIFILVILLGFGQGMENGISKEFQNDASNRISVWSGVTTVEHKGLNPGRFIQMKNKDFEFITKKYSDKIENKSSLYRIWNGLATHGKESGSYRVEGVHPDYQFLENETLTAGRYLNQNDIDHNEKVVVLGHKVKRDLFKEEDAIGKQLQVSGVNFKVVGVYTDPGGEREEARIFLPITTSQKVFNGGNIIRNMAFTLQPKENFEEALIESEQFSAEIQDYLKQVHTIAPNDMSAINVNNTLEQTKRFYDLIWMIRTFFWGVGICTIIAGVVGVSNIMLIIVKERTREIGVRKALGAQPWSIIGLVFSMALLEIIGPNIEMDYILNPSVNFNVAITTVFILIIAGAIAGFFPAWRAASIKPIEALRDE